MRNVLKTTPKTWTALGMALATSTAAYAAVVTPERPGAVPSTGPALHFVAGTAGEGGEGGEGGASEEAMDDVGFLVALGLVEGHMTVGVELAKLGAAEHSLTHMKHPQDEIYADLEPAINARNASGFAEELAAVADLVHSGADSAEIATAFAALQGAIDKTGSPETAQDRAMTIVKLVRIASEEYAVGRDGDKVTDPHEYQDAWGFVQASKRLLAKAPQAEKDAHQAAYAEIQTHLDALDPAWPDLTGASPVDFDPTLLAAAAARIELVALGIRD